MKEKQEKLLALYQEIEKDNTAFKNNTSIDCVSGCGDCCTRFEPYISVLEGIPIANYLEQNPQQKQKFLDKVKQNQQKWQACPFYHPEEALHCTIYSFRPLICRLFAFAANCRGRKKEYAPCKRIKQEMPQKVIVAQKLTDKGLPIPIYQEVAKKVQNIDFNLATDYHPFSKSVKIAMENKERLLKGEDIVEKKDVMGLSSLIRDACQ